MLLTISTTHEPASDLGYLLHKHPSRVQSFAESVGTAHVFYPEAQKVAAPSRYSSKWTQSDSSATAKVRRVTASRSSSRRRIARADARASSSRVRRVRGREYLRIIDGPDYTEPANLERLRSRGLGHKRSLASREYALGLEALDRVAHGEPLWRVHQCVFAVLALESEPVDPRL